MKGSTINIASVSDIHLGHPRTPTQLIADNFRKYVLPDNAVTAQLDVLNVAGDVWDRLLQLPEEEVYIGRQLIVYILLICAKYNIILRFLEGTPRHDRKQSKMVQELIDILGLDIDYKYMDGVQIEYIERLDKHVLYIQDEYETPEVALAEFRRLLAERGLEKVDWASMHGQFEFQLPDIGNARHKCHDSRTYLSLVRYFIFIGHDHTHATLELPEFSSIICAHGSCDRLAHGEEEPKGHIRARIEPDGSKAITFVQNLDAMDYRTLDVAGLSTDEVIALIHQQGLREGSHIRLKGDVFDKGLRMIRHLRKDFPQYRLEPFPVKEKKRDTEQVIQITSHYQPIQIGPTNVTTMVANWLANNGCSETEIKDCEDHLNEQINAGTRQQGARAVPDF